MTKYIELDNHSILIINKCIQCKNLVTNPKRLEVKCQILDIDLNIDSNNTFDGTIGIYSKCPLPDVKIKIQDNKDLIMDQNNSNHIEPKRLYMVIQELLSEFKANLKIDSGKLGIFEKVSLFLNNYLYTKYTISNCGYIDNVAMISHSVTSLISTLKNYKYLTNDIFVKLFIMIHSCIHILQEIKFKSDDIIEISNDISKFLYELYTKKNNDYGDSFASSLKDIGPIAAMVRIYDKFKRINNLLINKTVQKIADEKIQDTIYDLINYCYMTITELYILDNIK